jgi:lipopolysaccharide export system permease protein
MMRLDFFPSRTLTWYLARLFVVRVIGVLLMLVLVLQMLDLLGESGKILAQPGNSEAQLWTYVSMRMPQLIARFLPYSALLATIITLATLSQNSEVVAMKAAGLSAHQILAPLLITALAVSAASFAFNELVVARSTASLKAWQAADYGAVAPDTAGRTNVYTRDGNDILTAKAVSGEGSAMRMTDVTFYRRDDSGAIREKIVSPRATYAAPGWRLEQPLAFDVAKTEERPIEPVVVARAVTPTQVSISKVDAEGQNIVQLARSIKALKANGRRTSELEGMWWHKLSGPLSAALMPLLGAIAAFGLARSGQLLIRAVIGMALGFAYFVVDNAALAMGNFGGYPPLIAAWAPFLLFLLIGQTVLIKTEE